MNAKRQNRQNESEFFIPTTSDIFVHFLFGTKKYAPALVGFVNAVLQDSRQPLITKATVKNPFNPKTIQIEKEMILDILAEDESSRLYDFEVQVIGHKYFIERCLCYWSKVYSSQLTRGEFYTVLKPVTSIILTDFQALKEIDLLHTSFGILSRDKPHWLLTDHFDMHFLRVPDRDEENLLKLVRSPLSEWFTFFGYPEKKTEAEMKESGKKDQGVAMAIEAYEEFTQSPDLRDLAERRERFLRDNQARLETLSEEAWKKGKAEGLMEGRIEGELRAFLQLVEWILGEPSPRLKSQIEKLTDLAQINTLYEMVAKKQIQSLKELEQKLP